jgi:hypothetical protein
MFYTNTCSPVKLGPDAGIRRADSVAPGKSRGLTVAGHAPTLSDVLDRTQTRALPLLNKGVELTPALNACCGACRTCMTTNVVTLVMAGVAGAGGYIARLMRRRA